MFFIGAVLCNVVFIVLCLSKSVLCRIVGLSRCSFEGYELDLQIQVIIRFMGLVRLFEMYEFGSVRGRVSMDMQVGVFDVMTVAVVHVRVLYILCEGGMVFVWLYISVVSGGFVG